MSSSQTDVSQDEREKWENQHPDVAANSKKTQKNPQKILKTQQKATKLK